MANKSNFVFGSVPMIRASRSRFDLSHSHKTSGNVGKLYPFLCQEVYPGDTFKINATILARLSSAYLVPVMDNLFLDQYFFFVPSRLVFDKWAQVFGENKSGKWANTTPPTVPTFQNTGSSGNIALHDNVCAYINLPVGQELGDNIKDISLLPYRAFALIYDEWFRDENNVQPMQIQKGDAALSEKLNNNDWAPNNYLGKCPSVAKFHDYFTTCLPSPQKGDAVEIGTVEIPARVLPVTGAGPLNTNSMSSSQLFPNSDITKVLLGRAGYTHALGWTGVGPVGLSDDNSYGTTLTGSLGAANGVLKTDGTGSFTDGDTVMLNNLVAYQAAQSVGSVNVNDLRLAVQTQKMLEKDARGGTRYREYILSHFGVSVADSRVQVPEFLGGKRSPLNVQQVAQTSQNTADSPLASLGAFSLSFGKAGFSKGFTEHGYIIGCMCLRYHHTYQQGVERYAFRKDRLDFYDPVFANIGEQPVYKKELFASAGANEVFGYQEAWADLRYRPSRVSGQLASKSTNTLDIYHFGDEYANAPTLSEGFINETDSNFSRTIAIDDAKVNDSDQFVFDIYIQNDAIRELPVYSVPSLMDHH
ncbi:major capsid protein [Gokushovirinae sp.]|nr:major capsid protein [Gokushovirinae sp.]